MDLWNEFYGVNAGYVLELYERYLQDPGSVDSETRAFFDQNPPPDAVLRAVGAVEPAKAIEPSVEARPAAEGVPSVEGEPPIESAPSVEVVPDVEVAPSVEGSPSAAGEAAGLPPAAEALKKAALAFNLAESIRWYGHWTASLDPLGGPPPDDPSVHPETYGLTEADLRAIPGSVIGGVAGERAAAQGGSAWDAIEYLRRIYSATVGYDYLQIRNAEERQWLREAAETGRFSVEQQPVDPLELLRPPDPGGGLRAFLAALVCGQDALLDRGRGYAHPAAG